MNNTLTLAGTVLYKLAFDQKSQNWQYGRIKSSATEQLTKYRRDEDAISTQCQAWKQPFNDIPSQF